VKRREISASEERSQWCIDIVGRVSWEEEVVVEGGVEERREVTRASTEARLEE